MNEHTIDDSYGGHDSDLLVDQLDAVRNTGQTNMLDRAKVRVIASTLDHRELADWLAVADDGEYMAVLRYMGENR